MMSMLLYALGVAVLTITGLVFKYKSDLAESISLNAVKHRGALVWLVSGSTISGVLALIWYFSWVIPTHAPSLVSTLLFCSIMLSMFILIIIPDIPTRARFVHRSAGYIVVVLMFLFALSVISLLSSLGQVLATAIVAAQFAMLYLLFFVRSALRYLLQFQAVYLFGFFVVLLMLNYGVQ